ncbi:MAG: formate dehydrogenase accessory sulfurtransferase FdhD [Marmoricola sp.]
MTASLPRRPGPVSRVRVVELREGAPLLHEDRLAVEEPLEIRLQAPGLPARRQGITMRTPGHDFELAAGWLVHEGIVAPDDIEAVRYCTDDDLAPDQEFNVVTVGLARPPLRLPESHMVSSACGVCGADSIAAVHPVRPPAEVRLSLGQVRELPARMRAQQQGFDRTGGLHAAGLFHATGAPVVVREDVGRHNAVDKAVGSRILAQEAVPPVLVLSGRIAFELVQKAATSGITMVVAVGAPTSLAVDLAREAGLTLVGFTRPDRCVVYAGEHRLGV